MYRVSRIVYLFFSTKFDDTDDIIMRRKSNLIMFIDYGTGVHYIKAPFGGGLIPRLDKDGNIVTEFQQDELKE